MSELSIVNENEISVEEKYKMVKDIDRLSKEAHLEIFFYLKKYNVVYTTNKNGIFINMKDIDNNIMSELQKKVKFYTDNNKILENRR
jgi:hypothetical protein